MRRCIRLLILLVMIAFPVAAYAGGYLSVAAPDAIAIAKGGAAVFADFVQLGFGHILGGLDHLLFLLVITLAGSGLRYWIGATLAFTLAHAITLALGSAGILSLSGSLIEPVIAASVVVLAVHNLWCIKSGKAVARRNIAGIVFACGLLQGLEFAGVLAEMGLSGDNWLARISGFIVGIQLGQLAFVTAAVALAYVMARYAKALFTSVSGVRKLVPIIASLAALVIGSMMLVQRLASLI